MENGHESPATLSFHQPEMTRKFTAAETGAEETTWRQNQHGSKDQDWVKYKHWHRYRHYKKER